jgi:3-methyladenine DNA glycosylase/8-oxoguanine DNA glycosylase
MIDLLNKEILMLEKSLEALLKQHEEKKMAALATIPGIGKRTVAMMIIATDGPDFVPLTLQNVDLHAGEHQKLNVVLQPVA